MILGIGGAGTECVLVLEETSLPIYLLPGVRGVQSKLESTPEIMNEERVR